MVGAPFPGRERDRLSGTSAWHRPLPVLIALYHRLLGGLLFSLKIARSDTQERSYCNSVDSGKGTGRCRVYLGKEETLMPERYDERIVETPVQARQGVTGHNVRYVLAFSTCAVIAAFVIIYFLFFR